MQINTSSLKVHPLNISIYGNASQDSKFGELVESIGKHGVLVPLMVTSDNVIISGHRRYAACQKLRIDTVPVYVSELKDDLDIQEALIESNRQREKTNDQKAREFHKLKSIEAERAKRRQAHGSTAPGKTLPENFPGVSIGDARDHAAQKVGFNNPRTAEQAEAVVSVIDEFKNTGAEEKAEALKNNLNKSVHGAYKEAEEIIRERREEKAEAKKAKYTIEDLGNNLFIVESTNPKYKPVFNATNDNIEWAKWSWNPVTGCLHGCKYCYARAKAENDYYRETYVTKFNPTFHPGRLSAPANTRVPESRKSEPGINNVFVCSMADLFGEWVPAEWIEQIISVVKETPQFNFLFLTKNPRRYTEFTFPKNAWLGATADTDDRYQKAYAVFSEIEDMKAEGKTEHGVSFLSCEPLSEELNLLAERTDDGELLDHACFYLPFDWIIVGGLKNSENTDRQPRWEWVEMILFESRKADIKVYFKPNLTARPMEHPES